MLLFCEKILKGNNMSDPFAKLIRPKAEFDEETKKRLGNLLEPYVWLDPDNSSISFKEDTKTLNALQKILVFALARKVIGLINKNNKGTFSANEVEAETQIPGGTIRPKLVELAKKRILNRTDTGYELAANFFISEIEQILKK